MIGCLTVGSKTPLLHVITTLSWAFSLSFFFRIHVYVTREVYLGKSGRHTNTISRGKRVIYHGKSVPCCHTSNLLLQSLSYAETDYAVLSVSVHLNSLHALQGTYQVLCD